MSNILLNWIQQLDLVKNTMFTVFEITLLVQIFDNFF